MRWNAPWIKALRIIAVLISTCIAVSMSAGSPQSPASSSGAPSSASSVSAQRAVLERYCITCHTQSSKEKGLVPVALDTLDFSRIGHVENETEVWEKVVRKVNAGVMPPPGSPHPDRTTSESLVTWLTTQLDRAAQTNPNPGRSPLHRLNRTEYGNAIRDLLDLEIDTESLLPPDDSAYGFDNIADALGLSPSLQERYVSAAMKIAAMAVGDPRVAADGATYRIKQDVSQDQHIEGLPLGTIGGTRIRYNFPLDGEYVFQAKLYRTNLNIMRGLETAHEVEFAVDGERVLIARIGGPEELEALFQKPTDTGDSVDARLRVRVPVKAGPHAVTVTFVQQPQTTGPGRLQHYIRSSVDNFDWSGQPHIQTLTVNGPFEATGLGDTPSRRRIFTCRAANPGTETVCAKQILSALARRAYRQPVSDIDLQRIMSFFESGRAAGRDSGGFEAGIRTALGRILASPQFVFRVERDSTPGAVRHISDFELASRLSFFLWSSIPDDRLLQLAGAGSLSRPAVLEGEVRRMLTDSRSQALVENFAGQWLRIRNLRNVSPNSDLFPDFDDNLRQSFKRETELLFDSIIREDRNVLDLMTADYTFVNERLARQYGISGIYGTQFRRVAVSDPARRGLLGQGSFLSVTSHAERTSPVLRGKWILENILGLPVPPPPPNVPPLKERAIGEKPRTIREQMAEHRASPACASCHKTMDSIGFSLENFDAVGAWRLKDADVPVDASGDLADGTHVNGVVELREALLKKPDLFVGTMTEKLMTYALGRGVDYRDMPAVRMIVKDAGRNSYRFSSLVMGVVRSLPFQMRMTPEKESEAVADVANVPNVSNVRR
jgi:mono/diheme cytochrome c family protein